MSKNSIIKELKDYTYLFDFYVKYYKDELKGDCDDNVTRVHSRFVKYLRGKIYNCAEKLLELEEEMHDEVIRKSFKDIQTEKHLKD